MPALQNRRSNCHSRPPFAEPAKSGAPENSTPKQNQRPKGKFKVGAGFGMTRAIGRQDAGGTKPKVELRQRPTLCRTGKEWGTRKFNTQSKTKNRKANSKAAQDGTVTGAGGVPMESRGGSGAGISQSHLSLRQARKLPCLVRFSTMKGAPHLGHGSLIGS